MMAHEQGENADTDGRFDGSSHKLCVLQGGVRIGHGIVLSWFTPISNPNRNRKLRKMWGARSNLRMSGGQG